MAEKKEIKYVIDEEIMNQLNILFLQADCGEFEKCIYCLGYLRALIYKMGIEELK